eukprot:SAG25_NODE_631_length_6318_cov_6.521466_5_plen_82_part_00
MLLAPKWTVRLLYSTGPMNLSRSLLRERLLLTFSDSCPQDNNVHVWEVASQKRVGHLSGHEKCVVSKAVSYCIARFYSVLH